jgi:hypothetical protein
MVLLLRKPHSLGAEELRSAAERAWCISFAGGEGSMHFVSQSSQATFLKAGPHLLSFFNHPGPYIDNPQDNIAWLPQASQQKAWAEHLAYIAVDYLNHETDVELAYCVLAQLTSELIDENSTAVYVPGESSLIPNDESLYMELRKIASSRDSGVILQTN